MSNTTKLEYRVSAQRIDSHGSMAHAKEPAITLDTDVAGRADAFNPAELLLASLATCMIKGAERVTPMLHFAWQGMEVRLQGIRQDAPPKMISIHYEIIVDTQEDDRRLELLHNNILKYGTISNSLADAVELKGSMRRKD